MAYSSRQPNYDVSVEGRFVGSGQWVVHGRVAFGPDGAPSLPYDAESEARLDLMVGIARESRRGYDAGARNVHVVIEGDRELAGLFRLTGRQFSVPTRVVSGGEA